MDNCTQITDHCLACVTGEAFWKGYSNAKFPQDPTQYRQLLQQDIGGINNSKNLHEKFIFLRIK